jgi:hypothetical protein
MMNTPQIYIGKYLLSVCLAVDNLKVLGYPVDKVVLERTLYDLVEEVWRQKFMNVGSGKVSCEGLVE